MKQSYIQVQLLTALEVVVMLCVCSEALKLPINVKRNVGSSQGMEVEKQLPAENEGKSFANSHSMALGVSKMLFPEQKEEVEHAEYQPQNFRGNHEIYRESSSNDETTGLKRFYKYHVKARPRSDEVIVFPTDVESSENTRADDMKEISHDMRSRKGFVGTSEPRVILEYLDKHYVLNNSTEFSQSLETLAHLVRQLLFRGQLQESSPPEPIMVSEMSTTPVYDSITEINVQEQSLYSGPKLQPQSSISECPDGTKRTRNGSCQKPSRRLVTS